MFFSPPPSFEYDFICVHTCVHLEFSVHISSFRSMLISLSPNILSFMLITCVEPLFQIIPFYQLLCAIISLFSVNHRKKRAHFDVWCVTPPTSSPPPFDCHCYYLQPLLWFLLFLIIIVSFARESERIARGLFSYRNSLICLRTKTSSSSSSSAIPFSVIFVYNCKVSTMCVCLLYQRLAILDANAKHLIQK